MDRAALLTTLQQNAVFARVPRDKLERLALRAEVLRLEAGARVLEEGDESDHIFVLTSGFAGVFYSSPDGVDVLVKLFGAPAVFGEMELFFGQPRQEYVECLEPSVVVRMPAPDFLGLLRTEPVACYAMLQDVATRLAIAAYHERSLAFHDVPMRLAGLFLSFLEACGTKSSSGRASLRIKLTYETLARCLGVNVRSIDRTMTEWAREGWLERNRSLYTFTDVARLAEKADPERLALYSRLGLLPHRTGDLLVTDEGEPLP
jgi:CRP/FNR family cyclic AMP-dependent transcriptional regulator